MKGRGRALAAGLALGGLTGLLADQLDLPSLVSYWGDRVPLLVGAALAGAALGATPLRRVLAAVAGTLGALWLAVAFTPLAAALANGLVRREEPRRAEAVFVFSSRILPDGDPTSEALSRLLRGLELLGEGWTSRLVLSEQAPPERAYAAVARPLLKHLRLEAELATVGPVWNTRDEALALAALFRERGWRRVLAVTSPPHSRRACATLENEGLEVVCVPAVETRFAMQKLDRPRDRLAAFGTIVHERLGLWLYTRRGWIR